jgi:hypothetical protein
LKYPAALNGPQFLDGSFLKSPIEVRNGEAGLPRGAGLGIEVDEALVRSATPRRSGARVTGAPRFRFQDDGAGSLALLEEDRPVFVYRYGPQLKPGVAERYRRSCYLHPLYAPDGTVVTDDFPADHYHHRGLSWMWPIVVVDGKRYNLWEINGEIGDRFVQWVAREDGPGSARLAVENGWFTGQRKVMNETVELLVSPARDNARRLYLTLTFDAVEAPVAIQGTPTENKGYGGLSFRFAPREHTVVRTDKGEEARDTDMVPHPWAELEAVFSGRRAGARVDDDPSNPGYPNGWCLRKYGFLGVNFPGLKPYTVEPGKPLQLKYHVTAFSR